MESSWPGVNFIAAIDTTLPLGKIMSTAKLSSKTNDDKIDGVLSGVQWDEKLTLTYSFPTSIGQYNYTDVDIYDDNGNFLYAITYSEGYSGFNASQVIAAKFALEQNDGKAANNGFSVEGFTNLNITEETSAEGDLRFSNTTDPDFATAHAYLPNNTERAGDVWFGPTPAYSTPEAGNYAWHTVLHETGHALGLSHPHDNLNNFGTLPAQYDHMEYTVMSYKSYEGGPSGYYPGQDFAQTYMMLDIAALQHMYGADYTTNSGNTVYKWTPNSGDTLVNGSVAIDAGSNRIFATVWDGGGIDTYDLSAYASNLSINLNPGEASSFGTAQTAYLGAGNYASGNIYNAMLHQGDERSLIENAIGGSGNDVITGNAADNTLRGEGGDDTITGGTGNDLIYGNTENDHLSGQDGNDTLWGGYGDDTVFGGGGSDELRGNAGNDTMKGGTGDDILHGSSGNDHLSGNDQDDSLFGGSGDDTLFGGTGNDELTGGDDNDMLTGGSGADTLYGASGRDTLIGSSGNDVLDGGADDDRLEGGAGDDTLSGGDGNDWFEDQDGGDTYIGGAGADTVSFFDNAAGASANLETGASSSGDSFDSIENLSGSHTGADSLTGNVSGNGIEGNGGDDTLRGEGGDDTITGGTGNDLIYGNTENDHLSGQDGNDTLWGGYGDDTVFGGGGSDELRGNAGNDTMKGGTGDDILHGSSGNDHLSGNDQDDSLFGGSGEDTLFGGTGDDELTGGSDSDVMTGGSGADVFLFKKGNGSDQINDFGNGNDVLSLQDFGFSSEQDALSNASQVSGDVVFDFGSGDSLILLDLQLQDLNGYISFA
ncbi:M10 family metallopeptidase [Leisingera sp. JC11]